MSRRDECGFRPQLELLEDRLPLSGSPLANEHALPPGNPGTSHAVTVIPTEVFAAQVGPQWFGKAAGGVRHDL
jgi:hypothetical protein